VSELASVPRFACGLDKRPLTQRGFYNAKTDVDDSDWPLVGIPTGAVSGFDVVDVDLEGLCWLDVNWEKLPPTRTHATRSGGRHLLFRHADGLRCSAGRIGKGVDVRADGGYIIWWPRQGFRVLSDAEIADWAEWLLELARKKPPAAQASADVGIINGVAAERAADGVGSKTLNFRYRYKSILRKVEHSKPGIRNIMLHWAACRFGEMIAEGLIKPDVAVGVLVSAARTCDLVSDDGIERCKATIMSGLAAGQGSG
jgi:Bifunctional DNA primase/polymerase, N-terminal